MNHGCTRRSVLATAGGLLLGAALPGRLSARQGTPMGTPVATPGVESPRTIEHTYGATEITGLPERVVTVGLTEQDYLLALGVMPIATREWFGGYPGALWPWAQEVVNEAPLPEVLPVAELDFEQIVTLEPDLILGINSGLTVEEYDTLSQIAPTVAQPGEYADFGAPWEVITRTVGQSLGRSEQAELLIPDIEVQFEAARQDHPAFEESTALLAAVVYDGSIYIYAEGPAPRFLTDLGFELPPGAASLFSGEDRPPVQLSPERLSVLEEADVLVLGVYGDEGANILEEPLYQSLAVAREGRTVVLPEASLTNGALTFGSVLSLPIALDEMVPRLAAAVDGDPATEVEPVA